MFFNTKRIVQGEVTWTTAEHYWPFPILSRKNISVDFDKKFQALIFNFLFRAEYFSSAQETK